MHSLWALLESGGNFLMPVTQLKMGPVELVVTRKSSAHAPDLVAGAAA
jgi:hypothetical protein